MKFFLYISYTHMVWYLCAIFAQSFRRSWILVFSYLFISISPAKGKIIKKDKPIGVQSEQKDNTMQNTNQDTKYNSTHTK